MTTYQTTSPCFLYLLIPITNYFLNTGGVGVGTVNYLQIFFTYEREKYELTGPGEDTRINSVYVASP